MKDLTVLVLALGFSLSTVAWSAEDGDPCNECAPHGESDGRPESPDSPCDHHQEFHCCCTHTQAISTVIILGWRVDGEWSRLSLLSTHVRIDPFLRETFHVPLV